MSRVSPLRTATTLALAEVPRVLSIRRDGELQSTMAAIEGTMSEMAAEKLLPSPSRAKHEDLATWAYREIRRAIIELTFQPGQQVQEQFLAQWLGTSRTPVREALKRLQGEGLIEGMSSRGAMVAQVSLADIENAYQVVEVIEGLASRMAAARITQDKTARIHVCIAQMHSAAEASDLANWVAFDAELHDVIRACAANAKLDQVAHIVYPTIERVRNMYLLDGLEANRLDNAMESHRSMVDAIVAGDQDRAEALTRAIFRHAGENNLRLLNQWVVPLRRSF